MTRGQLAALIATRLGTVLDRAPKRRAGGRDRRPTHWAAAWIVRGDAGGRHGRVCATTRSSPCGLVAAASSRKRLRTAGSRWRWPTAARHLAAWQAARPALRGRRGVASLYRSAALAVAAGRDETPTSRRPLPARESRDRISRFVAAVARLRAARESGDAMTVLTAANQLTLLRLLLVPVFALCMLYGRAGLGARHVRGRRQSPMRSTACSRAAPDRRRSAPGSIRWPTSSCSPRCS